MTGGLDLSLGGLAFCGAVLFVAGFVRGYSGFGFSAVTVAGMALVTSPAVAVPMAILLEVSASLFQARSIWRQIAWRDAFALLAGGIIGNPLGIVALETAPPSMLKAGVYLYILVVSIVLLFMRSRPMRLNDAMWFGVGLIAGAINGATALSGLFIITVMTLTATPAARMRATIIAYIFFSDFYTAGLLVWRGFVDLALVKLFVLAMPVVAVGIVLGSRHFLNTTEQQFRRATLAFLSALSIAGLAQVFAGT